MFDEFVSQVKFTSPDGARFNIDFKAGRRSIYAITAQKAGSVLFDNILKDIARSAVIPYCDFEPQLFRQGVAYGQLSSEVRAILEYPGVLYLGFRSMHFISDLPGFQSGQKLMLVRDPRDVAVSYYFSMAKSHSVPKIGAARAAIEERRERALTMDVDEWVASGHSDGPIRTLMLYAKALASLSDVEIYRYEDIIFDKRAWVRRIADVLNAPLPDAECFAIADRHDLRPKAENPAEHVRQVTPGNYRKHLSSVSVKRLQDEFGAVFDAFSYQRE